MTTDQEQQIIQECQKGNLQKFEGLYEIYVKKIYDFAFYKTFNQELAEDITSQTFLKALEKIDLYNSDKGPFIAWLFQIAKNTTIDHFKAKKPDLSIDDVWDLPSKNDVVDEVDLNMKFTAIKKIFNDLDSTQRDILIMRLWHDLSYKEIAQITNKSEAACKMTLKRTLEKIRQEEILIVLSLLFTY